MADEETACGHDADWVLSKSLPPVARTPLVVSDGHDQAVASVGPVDQAIGEASHSAASEAIVIRRPAVRSFADVSDGAAQRPAEPFLDALTSIPIPEPGLATFSDGLGVEVNDPSGHPKGRRSAVRPRPTEPALPLPSELPRGDAWLPPTRQHRRLRRRARARRSRAGPQRDRLGRPRRATALPAGAFERSAPCLNCSSPQRTIREVRTVLTIRVVHGGGFLFGLLALVFEAEIDHGLAWGAAPQQLGDPLVRGRRSLYHHFRRASTGRSRCWGCRGRRP